LPLFLLKRYLAGAVAATVLSVGALAGIIAGAAVVGAGVIGTAIYFAVKNSKKDKKPSTTFNNTIVTQNEPIVEPKVTIQEPIVEPKYKPKGATVDIFNLNPNDPQSITARSPAIKNNNT